MAVFVSMLRGVNLAGHRKIDMRELRALYESLGFRDVQTYINSGNVIFRAAARDLAKLAKRIEDAIERSHGFRSDVILRTAADLREVIAQNPFGSRKDIEPNKLAITFLAVSPNREVIEKLMAFRIAPEELHVAGRELFIYFANGMARPKLSMAMVERALKIPGTSRNWNTTRKLLELAEKLETTSST